MSGVRNVRRPGVAQTTLDLYAEKLPIGDGRKAGRKLVPQVRNVTKLNHGDHACLPYSSSHEQQTALASYIQQGVTRGEKVVYITENKPVDGVRRWLKEYGVDSKQAISSGALSVYSTTDTFLVTKKFDPDVMTGIWIKEVNQALSQGYKGIRTTSEMNWVTQGMPGSEQMPAYESQIQRFFNNTTPLTALCQYDRRVFDQQSIDDYIDRHPVTASIDLESLYQDDQLQILPTDHLTGVRLIGEVDMANHQALASTLASSMGRQGQDNEVHLDVSELKFIDCKGAWLLVDAARRLPTGQRLLIHEPPSVLKRILNLMEPQLASLKIKISGSHI